MQVYRLVTIERGGDSQFRVIRGISSSLSGLVERANRSGWTPGNVSGTGLTIVETVFESVTG